MNNLVNVYKNINYIENVMREYDSLKQNLAQTFRDFYSDFKLLDGELAYNETYLIYNLLKKLNFKLYIKFNDISDLNKQFISFIIIRDYLIKTNNVMRVKKLDKQIKILKKIYTSRFNLSLIYIILIRRITLVTISTTLITFINKISFVSMMKIKKEYICF